jgi:hypothetical protein
MTEAFIANRCTEAAHEDLQSRRSIRASPSPRRAAGSSSSPFYEREVELGGHFMELGGWERAHGYAANEHLLEKFGDRVPVRENEWDNRHFWRVSNAEHLELSENAASSTCRISTWSTSRARIMWR